jgi:hypothetical protein
LTFTVSSVIPLTCLILLSLSIASSFPPIPVAKLLELHGGAAAVAAMGQVVARAPEDEAAPAAAAEEAEEDN